MVDDKLMSLVKPASNNRLPQVQRIWGTRLQEVGEPDQAVEVLRTALVEQPRDIALHYQLGLIFADGNKFSLSLEQYEAALREEPHNIDVQANLALALQNMGLLDRAAASWETLIETASQSERGRGVLETALRAGPIDR